jgi:N-[(2S)-2-amino-2-carboxyethyl]-L-glutamate dehydrogenase
MRDGEIIILKGNEILTLLTGREKELIDAVSLTYQAHQRGAVSLPHSVFLRFPNDEKNRIIALPAFLGDTFDVAGIKWVSSFPGNRSQGFDRASAVMILNSSRTGRPEAILEGSIISAKRTAASAALAAQQLHGENKDTSAAIIGCGLISYEIIRFLLAVRPWLKSFTVYDLDENQAQLFKDKCLRTFDGIEMSITANLRQALASSSLISIATTASTPYIDDLSMCAPGSTVLHISLRDLSPEVILSSENVVDDLDHVCRAQTSIHLTEQRVGNRDFVTAPLGAVLLGEAPARMKKDAIVVFSPFGLGTLDLAVGKLVFELALKYNQGVLIEGFLPDSWLQRAERM